MDVEEEPMMEDNLIFCVCFQTSEEDPTAAAAASCHLLLPSSLLCSVMVSLKARTQTEIYVNLYYRSKVWTHLMNLMPFFLFLQDIADSGRKHQKYERIEMHMNTHRLM